MQWVPDSEVVVAQSRRTLCVWYSIDNPDQVTTTTIKARTCIVQCASQALCMLCCVLFFLYLLTDTVCIILASFAALQGDVEQIERTRGRTEVVVDEGINQATYALDEALIGFGSALDTRDFAKYVLCDLRLFLSLSVSDTHTLSLTVHGSAVVDALRSCWMRHVFGVGIHTLRARAQGCDDLGGAARRLCGRGAHVAAAEQNGHGGGRLHHR